jgi:serine/threonine protein kinase
MQRPNCGQTETNSQSIVLEGDMAIEATVGARVGDYILVKKLGEGGMAEVWLARHATSAQLRAIKFLNKQFQGIPEVEARFQTEGESQLAHPNIVRIYEVGQFQGSSYLVMDFIDGRDLEKILDSRRGPLTIPESVDIAMQILAGLGFAHQSGIVHRDIKPSNVLVDSEGQAYLMDFGIAKALRGTRSVTQVNSRLGTPDYMSPEQIRNPRDVDRRSDIYSFGCLFYELLTGWPPFDRGAGYETEHDIKTAHVTALPTPPLERKAGIPAPLNDIALQCLNKAKEDRPQSCEEILAALDAYRLSVARPQPPPRSATVLDSTPIPASAPAISAPPPVQRRSTEVLPDPGIVPSPNPSHPAPFANPYGNQGRTPTVTDDAILAQAAMVAKETGPLNASTQPQFVPAKAQPPAKLEPAKPSRSLIMAAGSVLLLAALGGGGYLIFHKEPAPPPRIEITPGTGNGSSAGNTSDPPANTVTPLPAKAPDKRLLIVGDPPAGGPDVQLPADTARWKRFRISHKSLPTCSALATAKPVTYVKPGTDTAQILKQHPELASASAGAEIRPLTPEVNIDCGNGDYDAILIMANGPKLLTGTLTWSGNPTALGTQHITIIRSISKAMPGGDVSGAMFPAKTIKVIVRPAGAATVQLPNAATNFSSLDLFLPNPGQQTITIDWIEVPNP